MAVSTYRYIANEISKTFNYNFPDSTVTFPQIMYWVLVAENYIRQRSLKVTMTGSFLTEFTAVPVLSDAQGRKYFTLPSQVLDLENEKGIDYILYQQGNVPYGKQIRLQQTDADIIDKLYWNKYENPSPSNPYFYRVNQTIYTLGIENVPITTLQMGLYTALDTRPNQVNADSPIFINEEQVVSLREMVFGFAKLALVVPKDRMEVGDDERNEGVKNFAAATKQTQEQQ